MDIDIEIYRKILDNVTDGIILLYLPDPDDYHNMIIVHFNQRANEISRIDFEPYLGKTMKETFPMYYETTDYPTKYSECLRDNKVIQLPDLEYEDELATNNVFSIVLIPLNSNLLLAKYVSVKDKRDLIDKYEELKKMSSQLEEARLELNEATEELEMFKLLLQECEMRCPRPDDK